MNLKFKLEEETKDYARYLMTGPQGIVTLDDVQYIEDNFSLQFVYLQNDSIVFRKINSGSDNET